MRLNDRYGHRRCAELTASSHEGHKKHRRPPGKHRPLNSRRPSVIGSRLGTPLRMRLTARGASKTVSACANLQRCSRSGNGSHSKRSPRRAPLSSSCTSLTGASQYHPRWAQRPTWWLGSQSPRSKPNAQPRTLDGGLSGRSRHSSGPIAGRKPARRCSKLGSVSVLSS